MDELRRITCNDIEGIEKIAVQVFPRPWGGKDFAYFLAHECGWCRAIFRDGKIAAYLLALVVQGEMDMVSVATDPLYQRQGLAEKLVEAAAADAGVKRILLEVNINNTKAIRFYEKVGFSRYGKRLKYYEGKDDALLMERATKNVSGFPGP